jgi:hypothetical protein
MVADECLVKQIRAGRNAARSKRHEDGEFVAEAAKI